MIDDVDLSKRIAAMAGSACEALFEAYDISLAATHRPWTPDETNALCGVIGFVGSGIRGSCLLVGHESLILNSCPSGARLRDWTGELTNQLAGRLKAKFLKYAVEIALSTPIALRGVAVYPLARGDLKPMCFSADSGSLVVWVEVEVEPWFRFGQLGSGETGRAEGEIVLF